jgi:anaerobic C4-dicarboxylate transporter
VRIVALLCLLAFPVCAGTVAIVCAIEQQRYSYIEVDGVVVTNQVCAVAHFEFVHYRATYKGSVELPWNYTAAELSQQVAQASAKLAVGHQVPPDWSPQIVVTP